MSQEATKVAKEEYANAIERVKSDFEGSTVAGYVLPDGKTIYRRSPDVKTLKTIMEMGTNFSYVGKIHVEKTEGGDVVTLEDVDMSKVELEKLPEGLIKMANEYGKKMDRERKISQKKLEGYASQIPDEIKTMVNGLGSEVRYAIMTCLLKEGDQSYSRLKKKLGLDDRTLQNNLDEMHALVDQWGPFAIAESKKGKTIVASPKESIYGASFDAKIMMDGLFRTLETPSRKESRQRELRNYQRLGISPEEVRITRIKRTKELKPRAQKILEENPNIKYEELREKLGVNHEDLYRVAKVIGYHNPKN
jgi:hypothetical protein